jgi:hypothetical protein
VLRAEVLVMQQDLLAGCRDGVLESWLLTLAELPSECVDVGRDTAATLMSVFGAVACLDVGLQGRSVAESLSTGRCRYFNL